MTVLSFDQIKAAAAAAPQHVDIPFEAWGGRVRLKKLSASDGIAFGRWESGQPGEASDDEDAEDPPEKAARKFAKLLSLSIVDESGAKAFDSPEGLAFLEGCDFEVLNELGMPAMRLNGLLKKQATAREKN